MFRMNSKPGKVKYEKKNSKQLQNVNTVTEKFGSYWDQKAVKAGLESGTLIEGSMRISPKNFLDAYVNLDNSESDIYIEGIPNRSASLEGDVVVVELVKEHDWKVLSTDAVEYLTADETLAEKFLRTSHEALFNQWQYNRYQDGVLPAAVDQLSTDLDGDRSKVENEEQKDVNIMNPTNNLEKLSQAPDVTSPGHRENVVISEIKSLHKEIFQKVKEKCASKDTPDVTCKYNLETTFERCAERYLQHRMEKDIQKTNIKSLSSFTVIDIILRNNILSVKNMSKFPELAKYIQRVGKVVYISQKVHPRRAVGFLKLFPDKNNQDALFSPVDSRIPRMKVPLIDAPPDLGFNNEWYTTLFLVDIVSWREPKYAIGKINQVIGESNSFDVEKTALHLESAIDVDAFHKPELKDVPSPSESIITAEEIERRQDLRDKITITIDPSTAKDLDDAVSCVALINGNFEVGVHIADVTHYLVQDCKLDQLAAKRSTTIYMTDKVVPMLPAKLSEQLCSLDAGKDKLTFSIIWEISPDGKVISQWIGKAVIFSCCKLSYEHAQEIISKNFDELRSKNFPKMYGNRCFREIYHCVNRLNKIANSLRQVRTNSGSLRLDQAKYGIVIDPNTLAPLQIAFCDLMESNKLIEEFMLMANICVARKIYERFPTVSMLRQHPKPHLLLMENTCKILKQHDIHIDIASSSSLAASLQQYRGHDEASEAIFAGIVQMFSKTMQNAKYFCSGIENNFKNFHHYALNEQIYTHFTSPIRRYVDVIVHRLLAAAVDPDRYTVPDINQSALQRQASHCNNQKKMAKKVQEQSAELHLAEYIRQHGPQEEKGIVVGVLTHSCDILLLKYGIVKRSYCDKLSIKKFRYEGEVKPGTLILTWPRENGADVEQRISHFKLVKVTMSTNPQLKISIDIICTD